MALSYQESEDIKAQLLKQLGKFPEEKQEVVRKSVEQMPASKVEEFVQENNLTHLGNQCVFCSIIAGTNPSFKIDEDDKNLAILELNPISKGHTLIVPKSHDSEIHEHTKAFAQRIGEKLASRLSPKQVSVADLDIMGHALLQVVPVFGNEKERWQASEEELKSLQEELTKPKEVVVLPSKEPSSEEVESFNAPLYKLPPRIP